MSKYVNKSQKLLARKEQLLNDLKYYEARIAEEKKTSENCWAYDEDSSDSEIEFSIKKKSVTLMELRLQKCQLQTCLLATEELTGLTILQSEVNMLVTPPVFEGEPPVPEADSWHEVTAECKMDLVSFSISFFTHQPSRPFASPQYRALRVTPMKQVHARELFASVLPDQTVPSDAIETPPANVGQQSICQKIKVLHNYALAHRSRRCSLARLAEQFADKLYMEAAPEGGYLLKCGDLLQVTWVLQNKRSAIAPFLHKMAFDLEYMDECYIRAITQAHQQLCDPALQTDHRTRLLAQIIHTCLEARQLHSNRQTSDLEGDVPTTGLMGPPKNIPRKSKPKGKENMPTANERKRANDKDGESGQVPSKKSKSDAPIPNAKDKSDANTNNGKKTNNVEKVNPKTTEGGTDKVQKTETRNIDSNNKKSKPKNSNVSIPNDAQARSDSAQTKQHATSSNEAAVEENNENLNIITNKANESETTKQIKPKNVPKTKPSDPQADILRNTNTVANPTALTNRDETNSLNTNIANESRPQSKISKTIVSETNRSEKEKSENKTKNINDPQTKTSKTATSDTNRKEQKNTESVNKNNVHTNTTDPKTKEKTVQDKGNPIQKSNKNPKISNQTQNFKNGLKNKEPKKNNVQENEEQKKKNQKTVSESNTARTNSQELINNINSNNTQNKVSSSASRNTHSEKPNTQPVTETLSERFATHRRETFTIDNNTNKQKNVINKENVLKKLKTNNITPENNNKRIENLDSKTKTSISNQKSDKNAMISKSNNKNINVNKTNALKQTKTNKTKSNDNELNTNQKTNSNDKLMSKNQKLRHSPRVLNEKASKLNKIKSKIPHTKLTHALRTSPRKQHVLLSSTGDNSKSSMTSIKHTNIPRLLKKPPVKPN